MSYIGKGAELWVSNNFFDGPFLFSGVGGMNSETLKQRLENCPFDLGSGYDQIRDCFQLPKQGCNAIQYAIFTSYWQLVSEKGDSVLPAKMGAFKLKSKYRPFKNPSEVPIGKRIIRNKKARYSDDILRPQVIVGAYYHDCDANNFKLQCKDDKSLVQPITHCDAQWWFDNYTFEDGSPLGVKE